MAILVYVAGDIGSYTKPDILDLVFFHFPIQLLEGWKLLSRRSLVSLNDFY